MVYEDRHAGGLITYQHILFIVITAGFSVTVITLLAYITKIHYIHNCYIKNYLLLREYIGKTNSSLGGNCSYGCLMMDVVEIKNSYILDFVHNPPKNKYQKEMLNEMKQTFYFARERNLLGIEPYSYIQVRWCKTSYGDRIRGVWVLE